jgi:hypothetical protein
MQARVSPQPQQRRHPEEIRPHIFMRANERICFFLALGG